MSRRCTICDHPERSEIDLALVGNAPLRDIARQWRVSKDAVARHKADHLPAHLAKATEARDITNADDLLAELRRVMARVTLLFDACDRWLRDVDNPEQYDIGPRAEDLNVTYETWMGDRRVRRKERLSALLPRIEEERGITIVAVESKHADPRQLVLQASGKLGEHLELLAKLLGQLDEAPKVNILLMPEWTFIRNTMVRVLDDFPDAKIAVAAALMRLEHANGHSA